MTKTILAVIVLLAATAPAFAVEWQCGPHYVESIVMHGEKSNGIVVYPSYNRAREDAKSGGDEELSILGPASNHKNPPTVKGFSWGYAPHPEFRGQRVLTYRGKPCLQYSTPE